MSKLKDWVFGKKLVLKKTFDLSKAPRTLDERMDSSLALSHANRFIDDIIVLLESGNIDEAAVHRLLKRAKRVQKLLGNSKD